MRTLRSDRICPSEANQGHGVFHRGLADGVGPAKGPTHLARQALVLAVQQGEHGPHQSRVPHCALLGPVHHRLGDELLE